MTDNPNSDMRRARRVMSLADFTADDIAALGAACAPEEARENSSLEQLMNKVTPETLHEEIDFGKPEGREEA